MAFGSSFCVTTASGEQLHMGGFGLDTPETLCAVARAEAQSLGRTTGAFAVYTDWIMRTPDNTPVGSVSLMPVDGRQEVGITIFRKEHRGHGLGGAALRGFVCVAFNTGEYGLGLPVVRARVRPGNLVSRAALAGAGFYSADIPTPNTDPLHLPLEQVNPAEGIWEQEWARPERGTVPPAEVLAARRAATERVMAETVFHFCEPVGCPRLQT